MCVWSGLSLGGIYGTQIRSGTFNLALSLFGIPFVLFSVLFWSFALMAICGKVEVRLRGSEGQVFTGIGSLGFRRRFSTTEVTHVYEGSARCSGVGSEGNAIVLEGTKRLKFGESLRTERRYFVAGVLRALIAGRA